MPRRTYNTNFLNGSIPRWHSAAKTLIAYSNNNRRNTELEVRESVLRLMGNVLLSAGKRCHFGKKQGQFGKIFRNLKLFEKWVGDEESVDNTDYLHPPLTNTIKNTRFRLQRSITLQMFNNIVGLDIDAPTGY